MKGREGTWDVGWTCSLGSRLKVVEKRDEQHSDEVLALRLQKKRSEEVRTCSAVAVGLGSFDATRGKEQRGAPELPVPLFPCSPVLSTADRPPGLVTSCVDASLFSLRIPPALLV